MKRRIFFFFNSPFFLGIFSSLPFLAFLLSPPPTNLKVSGVKGRMVSIAAFRLETSEVPPPSGGDSFPFGPVPFSRAFLHRGPLCRGKDLVPPPPNQWFPYIFLSFQDRHMSPSQFFLLYSFLGGGFNPPTATSNTVLSHKYIIKASRLHS